MQCESFEYQVGGSLSSDSPSYVYREADRIFSETLRAGQFCYVLNSRQMGKSSLRVQAMRYLQSCGVFCIFVDLTGMGRQDFTPEKWYAGFVQALITGSQLELGLDWRQWWRERRDFSSPSQRLILFIEEILCPAIAQPIVIFVDEIDRVLSQSFSLDDFFSSIRYFSEKKADSPKRYPLTFALIGVARPSDLIQDRNKNPFNIGKAIMVSGFTFQEASPLMEGFKNFVDQPQDVLQEILDWTGGQPFLTQKLCQLVAEKARKTSFLSVDQIVRSHILDQWESQDEPEHLRTIRDRILRNTKTVVHCLELYSEILNQGTIAAHHHQAHQDLKLSGLIIEEKGTLRVHNRIYGTLFNQEWTTHQLLHLRPYSESFLAWCAAGKPSDQHLLSGESLEEAMIWAAEKQLSDKDYQYLVTSQQQATQSAQLSLEVNQTATRLLNQARVKAEELANQYRLPWPELTMITLGVTCVLLGLSRLGLMQSLELSLYDLGIRWRPRVPADERIVLINIDEEDIQSLGQWPISDQVLAETLQILQSKGVNTIGLDIYRDLPVESGYSLLAKQFSTSPNVFGIEKLVGQRIPPPASLSQEQIGFADQISDEDRRIRRALLSMSLDDKLHYSFATRMALYYLLQHNIDLQELDAEGSRVKLGQAVFQRLNQNEGGYQAVDDGGYQILLNWRNAEFDAISLRQVLKGESPPRGWRDRIVLMGVTSEGAKDYFYTPYSHNPFKAPKLMSGVSIHAQIVSLLISAALGERSLLLPSAEGWVWVWTGSWAFLGAIVGGRVIRPFRQIIVTGLGIFAWGGSWLILFGAGIWIAGAIGIFAFLGAEFSLIVLTRHLRNRDREKMIVESLQAEIEAHPYGARLALKMFQDSDLSN